MQNNDMTQTDGNVEPDWETAISLKLTPAAIIHALYTSADSVHTGWESCIEHSLIVSEITALDEQGENHCRLVEQEYVEDEHPDVTWHDWTVELKVASVYVSAHWRAQTSTSPSDWDWCSAEAERAFSGACVLVGKRVRRGLLLEERKDPPRATRTHH
jgi:hypothetical protein